MKRKKHLRRLAGLVSTILMYISTPAQIANTISPADKVFGLSKFWQEVNYNFVYLDKIGHQSWDSAYKAFIPQVQATQNDYEYYQVLDKFCALLKDGHTEIYPPAIEGVKFMFNTFGNYLLVLKRVDNKVIVERTFQKDAKEFPLGSEVTEVNGIPTDQYIQDSIAPYISGSTGYIRSDIASSRLLMGFPGSQYTVRLRKPDGNEATYHLTHAKATDSVLYPPVGAYPEEKRREAVEWKSLPDNLAYVALNTFAPGSRADSLFESLLPSLETSKGIIIDLRNNGGGDDGIAFRILQHFIHDSVMLGASSSYRVHNPYLKAVGRYVEVADTTGDERKQEAWLLYNGYPVYGEPFVSRSRIGNGIKRLSAPVVILTGHTTESAAEDFLVGADNQKHIIRMGEPTNGSTGQPYSFDMPGGGSARVCVKKDTYPDGREFVGYGIQPHIKVTPTVKDYIGGKDVVLAAAIAYFKEGNGVKATRK